MHGTTTRIVLAAVALSLLAGGSALAGEDVVSRDGDCSGRGEWYLRVRRETATTIRVRFRIEYLRPGDSWQLFLSDNGTRILARMKLVDADGEVRVGTVTADRSGTDRIKATGVNVTASGSCDAALAY